MVFFDFPFSLKIQALSFEENFWFLAFFTAMNNILGFKVGFKVGFKIVIIIIVEDNRNLLGLLGFIIIVDYCLRFNFDC